MEIIVDIIGRKGLLFIIGIMFFSLSYKYNASIFSWVEDNTFGTRNYILEKLELLFIEVAPDHITYALLFLSVGSGVIILTIFGFLGLWGVGFVLALIFSFIGFKLPKPIIDAMVARRIKVYSGQMVDALTLLTNGIRAGLSVPQAIGMVVDEMPAPISQEFNLILQQNKIGITLEECFDNLAKRVPTEDNDMFVSSINILRETGGNLAETFDTIVGVIRERIRLQQKIETMTASGMFQGMVIAMMPFGIGAIYAMSDPESMIPMFTTPLGLFLTFLVLLFDFAGFMVIMKVVKIKI